MQNKSRAFTLIELLVVVLIIGILAAVAVPQYKRAVDKSNLVKLLPLARAAKEANELYYLSNGKYAETWEELGFELPSFLTVEGGRAYAYGSKNLRMQLYGNQYLGVGPFDPDFLWIWNYDRSQDKGRLDCYAYNAYAEELRKTLCVYDEIAKHWVYK